VARVAAAFIACDVLLFTMGAIINRSCAFSFIVASALTSTWTADRTRNNNNKRITRINMMNYVFNLNFIFILFLKIRRKKEKRHSFDD